MKFGGKKDSTAAKFSTAADFNYKPPADLFTTFSKGKVTITYPIRNVD